MSDLRVLVFAPIGRDSDLTVSLQELSPRDGWLYFVATFDPHSATLAQVGAAMLAGGAQVLEGPP